ncbi:MAG TPA: hypothetical protein VGF92_05325 [Stellaceae bacterium]
MLCALAGCSRMSEVGFDTKMALGSVSMVDRCSDFMRRAFPNGDIDIVGSHIDTSMESALATVQGIRNGVAENSSQARNVAVECHFDNGVLTSFRWIAGPIRAAASGQAATGQAP